MKKKYLFDVTYQIEDEGPEHMIVLIDRKSDIEEIEEEVRRCYMREVGITREELGNAAVYLIEVRNITNK